MKYRYLPSPAYFHLLDLWPSFAVVQVSTIFWWTSSKYFLPLIHSWHFSTPLLQCLHPQSLNLIFLRPYLLCSLAVFSFPSRLFLCLPSRSLPAPPSQWLCGFFASLLRNGTLGTRALQSILQTTRPTRRTRSKCHVTTWQDDIWRRRGETAPKYLLLPAVLRLTTGRRKRSENTDESD